MANCGFRENEWFSCPTQVNDSRLFIALHLSGTSIAYEPEQHFQVSTLYRMVVLKVGGPLQGQEEVHLLKRQVML